MVSNLSQACINSTIGFTYNSTTQNCEEVTIQCTNMASHNFWTNIQECKTFCLGSTIINPALSNLTKPISNITVVNQVPEITNTLTEANSSNKSITNTAISELTNKVSESNTNIKSESKVNTKINTSNSGENIVTTSKNSNSITQVSSSSVQPNITSVNSISGVLDPSVKNISVSTEVSTENIFSPNKTAPLQNNNTAPTNNGLFNNFTNIGPVSSNDLNSKSISSLNSSIAIENSTIANASVSSSTNKTSTYNISTMNPS